MQQRINPADINSINTCLRSWAEPGEIIKPVAIERVVVADDAVDAFLEIVRESVGCGRTLLVADRTVMRRGADELKPMLMDRLARVTPLDLRSLGETGGEFRASIDDARRLAADLPAYSAMVSVGSGSVTDVAKYARHLAMEANPRARLTFTAFPTAPSVTAYTSALAVLTIDGVKRMLASRPPDAVVCDLRTLADAPASMIQAGFGDVIARSVAYGDWFLAHQIGMDDSFSTVPSRLLAEAEQRMIDSAEYVSRGSLDGVRAVTEAVLLAGMAMSIVSQTAPISGWEHVISHFLDMTAAHDGRSQALHGGQVGAATLVSARAYERAWANLDLDRITSDNPGYGALHERRRIESVFGQYDRSGAMTAEIWRDYARKSTRWQQSGSQRRRFAARRRGGEYESFLRQNVRSSEAISEALSRAGAPQRFSDLDVPIPAGSAHAAVQFGHLIRARFTLGDLLEQAGWLNGETAAQLLNG